MSAELRDRADEARLDYAAAIEGSGWTLGEWARRHGMTLLDEVEQYAQRIDELERETWRRTGSHDSTHYECPGCGVVVHGRHSTACPPTTLDGQVFDSAAILSGQMVCTLETRVADLSRALAQMTAGRAGWKRIAHRMRVTLRDQAAQLDAAFDVITELERENAARPLTTPPEAP